MKDSKKKPYKRVAVLSHFCHGGGGATTCS